MDDKSLTARPPHVAAKPNKALQASAVYDSSIGYVESKKKRPHGVAGVKRESIILVLLACLTIQKPLFDPVAGGRKLIVF